MDAAESRDVHGILAVRDSAGLIDCVAAVCRTALVAPRT